MNNASSQLKAYKTSPSLDSSKWYMGNLTTNLAESKETDGAFFLLEATLAPGTEPPPHAHSREDELFYVLEGEFDVYVGKEGFRVKKGECIFLPRLKPHAFAIRSSRLRLLTLFTPAGIEEAFRGAGSSPKSLDLPAGAPTYATTDANQTVERFRGFGVRFLSPDEVKVELPLYPKPLSARQQVTERSSEGRPAPQQRR